MNAIKLNNLEEVQQLLKNPALNINERTQGNLTPLHVAVDSGFVEIAALLLTHPKIKPDAGDCSWISPLPQREP